MGNYPIFETAHVRHKRDCVGAITLGKDMVFRDYAQGAYRLRGIGKGQKLRILIIPETVLQSSFGWSYLHHWKSLYEFATPFLLCRMFGSYSCKPAFSCTWAIKETLKCLISTSSQFGGDYFQTPNEGDV
jgi:hypothetical protein